MISKNDCLAFEAMDTPAIDINNRFGTPVTRRHLHYSICYYSNLLY